MKINYKGILKRLPKLLLAAVVTFSLIYCLAVSASSCIGSSSGSVNSYTVWLYSAQKTEYYKEYEDNPVLKYLLNQDEWKDYGISFDFQVPADDAQTSYSTMVTSGDFPTLMQNSVSDPAPVMYDNGYILDLTEYVKEYMPNYYALIQENEDLKNRVVFNIDGEEKILSLATLNDSTSYTYTGMVYRRDWIAKYGTNPSTGAAFTYTDGEGTDEWTDDVVFPSWYDNTKRNYYLQNVDSDWDGSEPVYISDWEWMFEIFDKALADLGITDGYGTSMYYPGYTWAGGLCSCFGEGSVVWYYGSDGTVRFGGTENSTRAYLSCMHYWYNRGWLDKSFNEHTSDLYYQVDNVKVRQGKVGMWQGLESDLGSRLAGDNYVGTQGMYVAGCAYPINDIYGDEDCQYVIPRTMNLESSCVSTGFFLMAGAEEKNLEPLLKFIDYLYSEDGAVYRSLGLSAEEYEASPDKSLYTEYGLQGGAYTKNEDGTYTVSSVILNDSGGLSVAATLDKLPGLQLVKNVDKQYAVNYENSLKSWIRYKDKGRIWGSVAYSNMSTKDTKTVSDALNAVLGKLDQQVYSIIKEDSSTTREISNKKWANLKSALSKLDLDGVSAILQKYLDIYPIAQS